MLQFKSYKHWNYPNYELRVFNDGECKFFNAHGKQLKTWTNCSGYPTLTLLNKNKQASKKNISRFIMLFTKGNSVLKNKEVDHIDGDKHNNNINNLRIVTKQENLNFGNRKEVKKYKQFTKKDLEHLWYLFDCGFNNSQLSRLFLKSRAAIINQRKKWEIEKEIIKSSI